MNFYQKRCLISELWAGLFWLCLLLLTSIPFLIFSLCFSFLSFFFSRSPLCHPHGLLSSIPFALLLPCFCLFTPSGTHFHLLFFCPVPGPWTVSSPADSADVYGADAAGRYHGAEVPIQFSSDTCRSQYSAGSCVTCHHHGHCQSPLFCKQMAWPDRWVVSVY